MSNMQNNREPTSKHGNYLCNLLFSIFFGGPGTPSLKRLMELKQKNRSVYEKNATKVSLALPAVVLLHMMMTGCVGNGGKHSEISPQQRWKLAEAELEQAASDYLIQAGHSIKHVRIHDPVKMEVCVLTHTEAEFKKAFEIPFDRIDMMCDVRFTNGAPCLPIKNDIVTRINTGNAQSHLVLPCLDGWTLELLDAGLGYDDPYDDGTVTSIDITGLAGLSVEELNLQADKIYPVEV